MFKDSHIHNNNAYYNLVSDAILTTFFLLPGFRKSLTTGKLCTCLWTH